MPSELGPPPGPQQPPKCPVCGVVGGMAVSACGHQMGRVYSPLVPVVSAAHDGTEWLCTLACGHTVRRYGALVSRPAPQRTRCEVCNPKEPPVSDLDHMIAALTAAEVKGFLTLAHDRTGLRSDEDTRLRVAEFLLVGVGLNDE